MPASVQCTSCRTVQQVSEASLGYQTQCVKCGKVFVAKRGGAKAKPWYLQWYVLAGAGGGLLLVLLSIIGVVVAVVVSSGSPEPVVAVNPTQDVVQEVEQKPSTPEAKTYALAIEGPGEVAITAGQSQDIDLKVSRDGYEGPMKLAAVDLPTGISATEVELAAGKDIATITLTAAKDVADSSPAIRLEASTGESTAEHSIDLQVAAMQPINFTAPAKAWMHPDGTASIDVAVTRNGHEGPIQIDATGLPAQITATPLTIAADGSAGKLLLKGVKAPEQQYVAKLSAKVGDQAAESDLQLTVESFAFRITPIKFPVEWVPRGGQVEVPITIERRSFKGPVKVEVADMPAGLTSLPLKIGENQTTGKLTLVAASDAKEQVRSGKIVVSAAAGCAETLLITRVIGGEGSLLANFEVDEELASTLKKGSFGGRLTRDTKQTLMDVFGGTKESERAVLDGLRWLASQQKQDGSWSLSSPGDGVKPDNNPTAATAFGVLPMLGAGVTPTSAPDYPAELGRYKRNVLNGLAFLARNQKRTKDENNGDLQGGMYAHALGTIALCEGYALTKDERLKVPAQLAVRYLMTAQHGSSGSWGYSRNKLGDTSIVAWVVLAIRSGQLAGLPTKRSVLDKTERFLNTTGAGEGSLRFARYAYKPVRLKDAAEGHIKPKLSTTAAGLLSRQYLGWQLDRKELEAGAEYLMQNLPPPNAAAAGANYYYYYATQVLHHLEGKNWDLWNHYMREHFIRCQEKEGPHKGSWNPVGSDHGARGGRMYTTSMCLLTLEVYYRHLPLYRKIAKPTGE